ncbi:hypothetical protein BDR22DRAFT_822614 [Usnea florida]
MDSDQSNNGATSSETTRRLPSYQYIMLKEEDDLEPESNIADGEALGGEPSSTSSAQDHVVPRSEEGQELAVALPVRQMTSYDNGRTAIPSSQNAVFQSVNGDSYSYDPPSDSSGKESSELSRTVGRSESQQSQSRDVDGALKDSGLEVNISQNGESSAGHSSSADDKRGEGAEVGGPVQHLEGDRPALDQVSHNDGGGTPFNRVPSLWSVLSRSETDTLPLLETGMSTSGPSRNDEQIFHPTDDTILPSLAEVDANVHRWGLRPKYQWTGFLPPEYETRRVERRTVDNKLVLFHGPTHMGPPLKPLDGPRAEEVAIEHWRRTMRDRDIREGRVL